MKRSTVLALAYQTISNFGLPRDMDLLECVQKKARKMMKGMEHLACEEIWDFSV